MRIGFSAQDAHPCFHPWFHPSVLVGWAPEAPSSGDLQVAEARQTEANAREAGALPVAMAASCGSCQPLALVRGSGPEEPVEPELLLVSCVGFDFAGAVPVAVQAELHLEVPVR